MISDDTASKRAFEEFAAHVVRSISMKNADISTQKVAEVVS